MRCRVLVRKLGFLKRVVGDVARGPSVRVKEAFSDDLSSLCLVRECEELEEVLMTNYTEDILRGEVVGSREIKENIRDNDRQRLLCQCDEKSPLIAEVAREVGWRNLWDICLSFGEKHSIGLQKLCRIMSHHGRGQYPCPLCENPQLQTDTVLEHVVDCHKNDLNLDKEWNVRVLMKRLTDRNISFLPKFRLLYVSHYH